MCLLFAILCWLYMIEVIPHSFTFFFTCVLLVSLLDLLSSSSSSVPLSVLLLSHLDSNRA